MTLKAKKPEAVEKRLKLFLYGPAGVGKTTASIQFKEAYVIDMENGTDFYSKTLNKMGSVVLRTNNPDEVKDEIKALLTEKHPYKTLIIDPITQYYNALQEKWNRIFEKYARSEKEREIQDFGPRYWGKVKSEYKSLQRMLAQLDMNVIVTSHQKPLYGENMVVLGTTYDSAKGDDYFFDLIFQLNKVGEKRIAKTIKERAELGENKFPAEFEWSYSNFLKYFGAEAIEREAKPVHMATDAQVAEMNRLLGIVKLEDGTIEKWLTKAGVNELSEMTSEQIQKCLDYLNKKLEVVKV